MDGIASCDIEFVRSFGGVASAGALGALGVYPRASTQ
jgi:hypothetical protein